MAVTRNYNFAGTIPVMPGSFAWPVHGPVIASYGQDAKNGRNKGIDIAASEGAEIKAAKGGVVVFCDEKMKGFGKTVIIDHGGGFQTIYAYNSQITVKVGDTVNQSDVIARAGQTGRAISPCVHFEIRRSGQPQDPDKYLSKNS